MEASPVATDDPAARTERIAALLRAERETVDRFLAAQEQRLEQAETTIQQSLERLEAAVAHAADAGIDEHGYQQRYELALEDLRQLKASNGLLQEQLAKARTTASALARQSQAGHQHLDWEAEKRRILTELEADSDGDECQQVAERMKIANVVRVTDRMIAQKNEEVQELRQQIEQLSQRGESEAGKAAAVAEAVDADAAIREERQRLRKLQEECQSKLSQGEIELSLERAKMARERAKLEERLRSAESVVAHATALANAAGEARAPGGRWLGRLGLTEADREPERHS